MKKLIFTLLLSIYASVGFAQTYTLMTSVPSKIAKGETSAEGFVIEVLTEAFKRAELDLRVKKDAWIRVQQKVAEAPPEQGLIIAPLTRTAEREKSFDWIAPIESYKLVFITNDRSVDITNIKMLKNTPICVYRESPAEYKLRELGFTKIRARVQEQKCFQGLQKGRDKVVLAHGKIVAEKGYKLVKGNPDKLIFGPEFEEETFYLAGTPGVMHKKNREKIRKVLSSMKSDGTIEAIRKKYL
jgi:polar amino acid transport system substrate-binding protein